jgi:hypothetical protein
LRVSNSRLQIAFGIDVQEFPISMPSLARARHGGTCSSATIQLARLGRAMPDGRLRGDIF